MIRSALRIVSRAGILVSFAGLACIVLVGHTPPGSVFWTAAGLVSLAAIPGGALTWAAASLVMSLTKKESPHDGAQ